MSASRAHDEGLGVWLLAGGLGIGAGIWARTRDSCGASFGVGRGVVKDQVGRRLTSIGGGRGAEGGVVLRGIRHHVGGGCRLGWVGRFGWLRLDGRLGLLVRLRAGLPLVLQLPQFAHRGGVGTLQARAPRGDAAEQGALDIHAQLFPINALFAFVGAREQPVGSGHGFQIEAFGGGLRLPLGFEGGAELLVILPVFGSQEEGAGAQAEGDGVEAGGGFTRGSFRAGGMLGILPVGLLLFFGN
jgi:hypothetical protein